MLVDDKEKSEKAKAEKLKSREKNEQLSQSRPKCNR
jgi:hypothetical protein